MEKNLVPDILSLLGIPDRHPKKFKSFELWGVAIPVRAPGNLKGLTSHFVETINQANWIIIKILPNAKWVGFCHIKILWLQMSIKLRKSNFNLYAFKNWVLWMYSVVQCTILGFLYYWKN